jgi:hypothetical protein
VLSADEAQAAARAQYAHTGLNRTQASLLLRAAGGHAVEPAPRGNPRNVAVAALVKAGLVKAGGERLELTPDASFSLGLDR